MNEYYNMFVMLYAVTVCMNTALQMYVCTCMYVCMGIASPVWWPGMARKVSMAFKMAFNLKFLPALEDAEKLMKDLDLDNA